ncbi:TPA: HAMP domain-containing histidine kinase [Candidatus Galligastranaerophilus intestinavium]|uniref:histidine kinase n=1 Tax=Candidatus Galligastranaerophilus intestinavium TaxID=2840836 RepID=A0A9D1JYN8_9BACT|nr:HAMP domain-containing histidine kinase [Candidatus Galligastranaerophilus intestinavium]
MDDIKEEFISTLSHEIRTPLTSIRGFSKTMLDNWQSLDDEQKKKFLSIIANQSQRLINLVENVLNVSKIDSGADDNVLTKVDAQNAINNAIAVVKANYKDFNFNFTICSKEAILADFNKLQQVLINVLDNAAKYSKNSKIIEINLKNDKNNAIISVKNFGVSIDEKYFDKIFDKFYRIDSHLKSTTQGSGLGLYITKHLLVGMGGDIKVKSGQNPSYSEFIVTLPLYEVEKATLGVLNKAK